MIKIRYGVFETNSSSVHSLILCSDEEYKAFEQHQLYYNRWNHCFITYKEVRQEIIDLYNKDYSFFTEVWNEFISEEEESPSIQTFDALSLEQKEYFIYHALDGMICAPQDIFENEYYESFDDVYTTKSGEVVHAFGYYGQEY